MSIAPPSDIVLDVAQAADPIRRDAAIAKLAKLASGAAPSSDFAASMAASSESRTGANAVAGEIGTFGAAQHAARPSSPYQKFEAVLLQTFMQEILPKNADLYGDDASADACRSMLAEQMANQLAATGKFGIAKAIEAHGKAAGAVVPAEVSRAAATPDLSMTALHPFRKV